MPRERLYGNEEEEEEEEEAELFCSSPTGVPSSSRRQRLLLDERGSLEFPINVECTCNRQDIFFHFCSSHCHSQSLF